MLKPRQIKSEYTWRHQLRVWLRQSWVREFWLWARCRRVIFPHVKQLAESIATFPTTTTDALEPESETAAPIFVFATSWRAGSTLLQRILVTDPRLLLWGEPLGEMTLIPEIVKMIVRISDSFPHARKFFAPESLASSSMATSWIGTLYPPAEDFRLALRKLFDQWLGEPARQRGFVRWGFKEVRLGATEASLLHWLYPRAKFVILSRHPYDCYRSLSDAGWHHVYFSRPDVRVDSAAGFARHWNRLAESWSELPAGFPAFHIRYEDLVEGRVDFRKLELWLGLKIQEETALSVLVGHTAVRQRLRWYERLIISREAEPGMRALGYSKSLRRSVIPRDHLQSKIPMNLKATKT